MFVSRKEFDRLADELNKTKKELELVKQALGIYETKEVPRMYFASWFGKEIRSREIERVALSFNMLKDYLGLEYVEESKSPAKLVKKPLNGETAC